MTPLLHQHCDESRWIESSAKALGLETNMIPQKLTMPEIVFATDVKKLMPPMADIPSEFKRSGGTVWNDLFSDWFFLGLKELHLKPKNGISKEDAMGHIRAIMTSWDPSHEDKEAAVSYLLSIWFESPPKWKAKQEG
jgi:hypothetical protein